MAEDALDLLLDEAMLHDMGAMVPPAGRIAFLQEIFGLFTSTTPPTLSAMQAACQAMDAKALAQEAHRLKGSCLSIGAVSLGERCAVLELAARSGTVPADSQEQVTLITQIYTATQAALGAWLASNG